MYSKLHLYTTIIINGWQCDIRVCYSFWTKNISSFYFFKDIPQYNSKFFIESLCTLKITSFWISNMSVSKCTFSEISQQSTPENSFLHELHIRMGSFWFTGKTGSRIKDHRIKDQRCWVVMTIKSQSYGLKLQQNFPVPVFCCVTRHHGSRDLLITWL